MAGNYKLNSKLGNIVVETEKSLLLHLRRLTGKTAIGRASFFQQMGYWETVNVRLPPLPLLAVRASSSFSNLRSGPILAVLIHSL